MYSFADNRLVYRPVKRLQKSVMAGRSSDEHRDSLLETSSAGGRSSDEIE